MSEYAIRYRKPGDRERTKRTAEGRKRRFTLDEAERFIARNRVNYPNARIVRFASSPKIGRADKSSKR